MLAKELKIKTLKKQREFIEKQLTNRVKFEEDGNASYSYIGCIYPEVKEYFEKEGFEVTLVNSDMALAMSRGVPVYVFTIKDDIKLSDEEMQEAEAYVQDIDEIRKELISQITDIDPDDFFAGLFGRSRDNKSDGDDCDKEDCDGYEGSKENES